MRLLIVRRGDPGVYQRFRAQLAADPTVKVIVDRRWTEECQDSLGKELERPTLWRIGRGSLTSAFA